MVVVLIDRLLESVDKLNPQLVVFGIAKHSSSESLICYGIPSPTENPADIPAYPDAVQINWRLAWLWQFNSIGDWLGTGFIGTHTEHLKILENLLDL
jgi:hypothetical protein